MKKNNVSPLVKYGALLAMSVAGALAQTSLAVKPAIGAESPTLSSSRGSIVKIQSMAEVFRYVNRDTLLIFDIDNTLLETRQMLGNEAFGLDYLPSVIIHREGIQNKRWVPLLLGDNDIDSIPTNELFGIAINLWKTAQTVGGVRPVEPIIPQLLAKAQKDGIQTMALSAAPSDFMNGRRKALQGIGIDFNRSSAPVKEDVVFIPGVEAAPKYSGGMMLTNFQEKGMYLLWFLIKNAIKTKAFPKQIVFVDDNLGQTKIVDRALASVEEELAKLAAVLNSMGVGSLLEQDLKSLAIALPQRIPHLCLRYSAADSQFRDFDSEIADYQLDEFLCRGEKGPIPSDQNARTAILSGKTPDCPPTQ
jgi:hypothetical protein